MNGTLIVARCETVKLRHQLIPQITVMLCLAAPFVVLLLLRVQGQLPRDSLFGRWAGESGAALPLLLLAFSAGWVFPLLGGLAGGDNFSGEDRDHTWETLLTRSRSRAEIFRGKVCAAAGFAVLATVALGASSVLAGLLARGADLVALDGTVLPPGRAAALSAASWFSTLPAVLMFTALAVLLSVASRSSALGIGGPVILGLGLQLLGLADLGPVVHQLSPVTPFDAWHTVIRADPSWAPAVRGLGLSAIYTLALLAAAGVIFVRRDQT